MSFAICRVQTLSLIFIFLRKFFKGLKKNNLLISIKSSVEQDPKIVIRLHVLHPYYAAATYRVYLLSLRGEKLLE